jgi:Na+/melibiose symporter-like transporter
MKNTFAVKKKSYFFSFCFLHISSISFFLFLYELTQNKIKHTQKNITTNQNTEKNLSCAKNLINVTHAIINVIPELK